MKQRQPGVDGAIQSRNAMRQDARVTRIGVTQNNFSTCRFRLSSTAICPCLPESKVTSANHRSHADPCSAGEHVPPQHHCFGTRFPQTMVNAKSLLKLVLKPSWLQELKPDEFPQASRNFSDSPNSRPDFCAAGRRRRELPIHFRQLSRMTFSTISPSASLSLRPSGCS